MNYDEVVDHLKAHSNADAVEGMARFGINPTNTSEYPSLSLEKCERNRTRPSSGPETVGIQIHEARILAAMIDDPKEVTKTQMESWVKDFDSWDVCDHAAATSLTKPRMHSGGA